MTFFVLQNLTIISFFLCPIFSFASLPRFTRCGLGYLIIISSKGHSKNSDVATKINNIFPSTSLTQIKNSNKNDSLSRQAKKMYQQSIYRSRYDTPLSIFFLIQRFLGYFQNEVKTWDLKRRRKKRHHSCDQINFNSSQSFYNESLKYRTCQNILSRL